MKKDPFFANNKKFLFQLASKNTKKNEDGATVISKNDEDFNDNWDDLYERVKNEQSKCSGNMVR